MLLEQIIYQLRKEICDNSRDRADDDTAENVGGVVNHKVIAACSHYENVERADRKSHLCFLPSVRQSAVIPVIAAVVCPEGKECSL